MALVVEATTLLTYTGAAANPVTISYSMTNGTAGQDRVLVVAEERADASGLAATYNAQAMAELETITATTILGALLYLEDASLPTDTDPHDIALTFGGTRTDVTLLVLELSGAKQSVTPNSTADSANSEEDHILTHITVVDSVATFLFYFRAENRTIDTDAGATVLLTNDAVGVSRVDGVRVHQKVGPATAGTADYTWAYTATTSSWGAFAVDIEAAAGGGALPPHHRATIGPGGLVGPTGSLAS